MRPDIARIVEGLESVGYVADRTIATAVHLALAMEKPLLVEGAAGVGKTEIAKAMASWLEAELIRLQCYEGLDLSHRRLRVELPEATPSHPSPGP